MAETSATRTETFPVGIVGVGLTARQRQVPADEPPPLPPNAELAVIGKPHPRLNGRAKVTGAIRYTVDVAPKGMLYRPHFALAPSSREVRAIDTGAAERDPRVRAIVRAIPLDDPAHSVVRYVGQPVVALAATSMAAAEEALHLIRVDLQTAALRRRSRRGATAGIGQSLRSGVRAGKFGRRDRRAGGPAGRRQCARARPGAPRRCRAGLRRARRRRGWRIPHARCRRIAAWSRTGSSPIGAPTD